MKCFRSDPKLGEKIAKTKIGKTWEEIYGLETASRAKQSLRDKHLGKGNPFYGKHHTEKTKRIVSEKCRVAHLGKKHSPETREKIRQAATGRKLSEETKRKISETKKGVSVKRTKVQKHYKTSQLEAEFQRRHPDAIPKHAAYGYEWDFYWQGWLVEIDGDYWHGLDRAEGFTPTQLNNMKNDQNKNRVVVENKAKLLRFKGTRGADLEEEAYVTIKNEGKI